MRSSAGEGNDFAAVHASDHSSPNRGQLRKNTGKAAACESSDHPGNSDHDTDCRTVWGAAQPAKNNASNIPPVRVINRNITCSAANFILAHQRRAGSVSWYDSKMMYKNRQQWPAEIDDIMKILLTTPVIRQT